jgi:hypothetical protein
MLAYKQLTWARNKERGLRAGTDAKQEKEIKC